MFQGSRDGVIYSDCWVGVQGTFRYDEKAEAASEEIEHNWIPRKHYIAARSLHSSEERSGLLGVLRAELVPGISKTPFGWE
jgi:hypothetical protein